MDKKKRVKKSWIVVSMIIVTLLIYNIYQYNKIESYKSDLKFTITSEVSSFASSLGNFQNETVYRYKYANIVLAHDLAIKLNNNICYSSEDTDTKLTVVLHEIEYLMNNDREKFERVIMKQDVAPLLLNICNNLEDTESLNTVYKLLKE